MTKLSKIQRVASMALSAAIAVGMASLGMGDANAKGGGASSAAAGARAATSVGAARAAATAGVRAATAAASRAASGTRAAAAANRARLNNGPRYTTGNGGGGSGGRSHGGGGYSMGGGSGSSGKGYSFNAHSTPAPYGNSYFPIWYHLAIMSNNSSLQTNQAQTAQKEQRNKQAPLLINTIPSKQASASCVFLKMAEQGWATGLDKSDMAARLGEMNQDGSLQADTPPSAKTIDRNIWAAGKACLKME